MDNIKQQINELIAQVTDEVHLDKIQKESEQQQLNVMQQRLDNLKGIKSPLPKKRYLPKDDEEAEVTLILEQIADEQRLKNLEKKSMSPNTMVTDDNLYMGNINSAELIDDTHHEDTLTKLAKANSKPADKPTPHPSSAQGLESPLQRLKNLMSLFVTNIIKFATNIINFFKEPNKQLEPINTLLKPINNEIISTVTKKQSVNELQPKDWHRLSSTRRKKQVLASTLIDKKAQDINNLQKDYKAVIAARKQSSDERLKKISEKQSSNSNRPR